VICLLSISMLVIPSEGVEQFIFNSSHLFILLIPLFRFDHENSNLRLFNCLKTITFWDMAPCRVEVDRRFGGGYCLHHHSSPWWWRQYAPLRSRST